MECPTFHDGDDDDDGDDGGGGDDDGDDDGDDKGFKTTNTLPKVKIKDISQKIAPKSR